MLWKDDVIGAILTMSITLYLIPNTDFYIDEMYNMCDYEGNLYAHNGYTITFNNYLYSLEQPLRQRMDGPAYGDTPLPTTMPRWQEMQKVWTEFGVEYGIKDSFAYVRTVGGDVQNAPGIGSIGPMLFCKSNWAQRNKKSFATSPIRSNFVNPMEMNKRAFVPKALPTRLPPPFMLRGLRI